MTLRADKLSFSGDTHIDRRYDYALRMIADGEIHAAIDLLEQSFELMPSWPPLSFQLGLLYQTIDSQKAIFYYNQYLQHDPADHMGATVKLALLQKQSPHRLPPDYIRALFDQYAPRFDKALQQDLSYGVPQAICDMLDGYRPARNAENVLDIGCGTGLSGEQLRHRARSLTGVDLSEGMIAQARVKNIYDDLLVADIHEYWDGAGMYDLVVAADVLVYIGALDSLMKQVTAHLTCGGLFAFSVQRAEEGAFHLGADHRYAHHQTYIAQCLSDAGLNLRALDVKRLRTDGPKDIMGYIVLAEKLA